MMVFAMGDVAPIEGETAVLDQNPRKSLVELVSNDDSFVVVACYAV